MARYYCFYRLKTQTTENIYFVEVESIGDVEAGFWIDPMMAFTKAGDCKYWIPPSAILYVEKING